MSLTTAEVAPILGIGEPAVRKLVERGKLRPIRAGARPLRFTEEAVATLLRSRWWKQQREADRSQLDDAWAEIDGLVAAQVSDVSRSGHAEPSRNQVEGQRSYPGSRSPSGPLSSRSQRSGAAR